ncbi:hypothetical protein BC832DRAFT_461167 [Gaertneriomyces semiglobifer]|nr:hypothetical protein BC832DRAFT_461167 [Gaertneriomyces semiglobifer]
MREKAPLLVATARQWARGCQVVERYIDRATSYLAQQAPRLQQRGRFLLRLLRDAGTLDVTLLDAVRDSRPANTATKAPAGCDIALLVQVFQDQPHIGRLVAEMVEKGLIVDRSGSPVSTRTVTTAATISLLDMAANIKLTRSDLCEQDIRLVWAGATRSALGRHDVEVSLEFPHSFEPPSPSQSSMSCSDVTISVRTEEARYGVWVSEAQRDESGGVNRNRPHKDWLKVAGQTAQKMINVISAVAVSSEKLDDIKFHYGLISKWTMETWEMSVQDIDGMLWFVRSKGPRFCIGPDAEGMAGILAYGEYLTSTIVPACAKVQALLGGDQEVVVDIVSRLPTLAAESFRSRQSVAPLTPRKRTSTNTI